MLFKCNLGKVAMPLDKVIVSFENLGLLLSIFQGILLLLEYGNLAVPHLHLLMTRKDDA